MLTSRGIEKHILEDQCWISISDDSCFQPEHMKALPYSNFTFFAIGGPFHGSQPVKNILEYLHQEPFQIFSTVLVTGTYIKIIFPSRGRKRTHSYEYFITRPNFVCPIPKKERKKPKPYQKLPSALQITLQITSPMTVTVHKYCE